MSRWTMLFAVLLSLGPVAGASPQPVVYAHRGGADEAPENTLGAFRRAHELYAGVWLEMDVQLAKDGELVVIHDHTLDRTTDCTGHVAERTSRELASCDAAVHWPDWGPEPVPTLRQVLEEGTEQGWRIMVELKNIPGERNFDPPGEAAASALVALVEDTGFPPERLLVQSFWPLSLDRVKLLRPDLRVALLTTAQLPGAPAGAGFTATENAAYAAARRYEVSAPDVRSPDLSAESVAAAHALGLEVVVWTVDEEFERVAGYGVDGIITNRPAALYP